MAVDDEDGAVLGLLVLLLRYLLRWSQADLARAAGVHKSQISDYELGQTLPREIILRRLAAAVYLPWVEVVAVLPALRALNRLARHPDGPDGRGPALPGESAMARGRAAAAAFRREVAPFLRERLPALGDPAPPESAPKIAPLPADPSAEARALGLLLVLLRALRRWSQEELARASGVQRSQVSTYELGKKRPRRRTLARLAGAVGVPLDEALEALPFLLGLVRRRSLPINTGGACRGPSPS